MNLIIITKYLYKTNLLNFFIIYIYIIEFIIGIAILIYLSNKNNNQNGGSLENYHNTLGIDHSEPLKNLYGETLQPCKLRENDQRGSWDNEGICSELGDGVHQICFKLNEATKGINSIF